MSRVRAVRGRNQTCRVCLHRSDPQESTTMTTVTRAVSRFLVLAPALLAGATALAAPPILVSVTGGGALAGPNGMTLYTFDKDEAGSGKSACNGTCASNWPPLFATGTDTSSSDYSIVTRDDGKRQWAYRGKPLYYWSKDRNPGDMTGDGMLGAWHVAKP
jgi:predicted lipoprotein with Yx(FWY)xxD motif